jgi:hypothetical protein
MFRKLQSSMGTAHESVMWPVHGHYECRACGRRYDVFVEAPVVSGMATSGGASQVPVRAQAANHA